KWIKILIDKYSSQLFINKRLKRYIDNGFYIEINKKSLVKSNLYFKDHIGPMKKLDLIFQYLNENGHNKEYYLIEETGLSYNRKVDYDKVLRVQYKYLQAQIDDHFFTHDEIYKKVVLYLVFIIWRKIRVATKAPLRKNFFNQKWYDLQVFEHFVELIAILEKRALVHEYYQKEFLIKDKKFKNISTSLLKSFELSQEEKNDFYWKCYNGLTNYILKKKILSEFQVKNPLIIQFEIEYWKYENLRH
ncbi:hypothetical protein KKG58_00850, partial [Patescibacteria group bacterium]|nr:hypothetical protein [Patescibacteria group bacterium]